MPTSYKYDVFLCHATADKPAVETLTRKLRDAGLKPFLDKWHLIPGQPWQEALEKALEDSRTVAVFLGPGGLGPWQHEEMRAALDQRVKGALSGVIPVLLPGAREKDVPPFLVRMTWVDFGSGLDNEDAFHHLVCGIRGVAPEAGAAAAVVPYRSMAQPPEGFVERRELEKIIELLCAVPADADATVAITTALRGAGGFGKTTLAQALAFDDRVRRTYPGGILWVTMGESVGETGRVARIRDLLRWWQGEEPPAFETPGAAGAQLREALVGERVLLVLDDGWKYADVAPFRGLAPGSALLVTTRDSRTLPPGSRRVEVDAMQVSEAVKLLASGLEVADATPFAALASRLGEWPLLLKLVNRQLVELVEEGGLGVGEALREVGVGLDEAGLTAFDVEDHDARELAVSRTLEVGLRRLSEEDRERFTQLAVFPEDTDVPLAVVERLWSLGGFATKKLCARLYDLSLLLRFERETATIRLHDVVRQYLLGEQREALPDVHRGLLERCRPASGRWSELAPEDDYLWRHLAHHLVAAGDCEILRELLLEFRYLRAKLDATDVNALLADYDALPGNAELRVVQGALRLSAHVVARDGEQLAGQLLGRLVGRGEQGIRRLLRDGAEGSWFRPRLATLTPPGGPLLRTLEGHTGTAVAVLDQRRVVSGAFNGTLWVWDVETGEQLRALEGGRGAVAVLDQRWVISTAGDETLWVWDVKTGKQLRALKGHASGVNAVAVLDQRRVVSAAGDETLRVWDVKTGKQLRALKGWFRAVAVLDQRRVVLASYDDTLWVWDVETGEQLRSLEGHTADVKAVAVLDQRRVVSASSDRTLRVWDVETGEQLRVLEGHTSGVNAVAVLDPGRPDPRRVVSASYDRTLRVWDVETGEQLCALKGHTDWVHAVAVLDQRRVVSASSDCTLRMWDVETEELRALEGHAKGVTAVTMLDQRRVVSAATTLRVWNIETGEHLRALEGHTSKVQAVAVLDQRRVVSAAAADDSTLRVWDVETGDQLRALKGYTDWRGVAVLDRRRVFAVSIDGIVWVWNVETGEYRRAFRYWPFFGQYQYKHDDDVGAVAVLDHRRMVAGSADYSLRVWDLEMGSRLRTLEGHTAWVLAVAVLDPRRVVSASEDQTLRVWDVETGEQLRVLEGHTAWVRAVAVLDPRRVVSASDDQTLRVWDIDTARTLAVFTLDAPAWAVAFGRDRRILVAGDTSGRVHFLDLIEPVGTS